MQLLFLLEKVLFKFGDKFFGNVQQLPAADHALHLKDIGPEFPVPLHEGYFFPHMSKDYAHECTKYKTARMKSLHTRQLVYLSLLAVSR